MKNRFKHIINEAKRSTLQKEEKSQIRETLFSFMQEHPVRNGQIIRHRYQNPNIWMSMLLRPAIVALLLVFVVGGGVGYAAEKSLPGDLLFSVKVNINEEIHGLFVFSEEAKANWQIERVERRLKETEKLALQDRLNKQTNETITSNFENHVNSASGHIAALEAQGNLLIAEDLNSRLESSLIAHEKVFQVLSQENMAINPVSEKVSDQINKITNDGIQIEEKISREIKSEPDGSIITEEKLRVVTSELLKAQQVVTEARNSLGAESTAHAEQQLELAESTIAEGNAKVESNELQEAFILFEEAQDIIEVTNVIMEVSSELQIIIPVEESIGGDIEVEPLPESDGDTNQQPPESILQDEQKNSIEQGEVSGGLETNGI